MFQSRGESISPLFDFNAEGGFSESIESLADLLPQSELVMKHG
jgi:hypothetical protein